MCYESVWEGVIIQHHRASQGFSSLLPSLSLQTVVDAWGNVIVFQWPDLLTGQQSGLLSAASLGFTSTASALSPLLQRTSCAIEAGLGMGSRSCPQPGTSQHNGKNK